MIKKSKQNKKLKREIPQRTKLSQLWPIGVLVLGIALVVAFLFSAESEPWGLPAIPRNPRPATLSPARFSGDAGKAYQIAQEVPDLLERMPCYCGCYVKPGHQNNLDCYTDRHGAGWKICIDITLDAYEMYKQGKKIEDIKKSIDEKYSRFWPYEKKWLLLGIID